MPLGNAGEQSHGLPLPPTVLFVVNPAAGKRQGKKLLQQLRRMQELPQSRQILVQPTEYAGHAEVLARTFAVEHGTDGLVISCGGDGTLHEVANGLLGSATAMGLIPIGTANDFARLIVPKHLPLEVLPQKLLDHGHLRVIDLIQVNERVSLNVTSTGFDTIVLRKTYEIQKKIPLLGGVAYYLAVILSLFGKRDATFAYDFQVLSEGLSHAGTGLERTVHFRGSGQYILTALCNGRHYGNGFTPAPDAQLDDGLIDAVLVESMPLSKVLGLVMKYKKGTHLSAERVRLLRTKGGRLVAPPGEMLLANMDGIIFRAPEINYRVLPQALPFAFYSFEN